MNRLIWMNNINRSWFSIRKWWWGLRHEAYLEVILVPSPVIHPSGGDDTKNIQAAIDSAGNITNEAYIAAQNRYQEYKIKWLHRKPILKVVAKFRCGTYRVGNIAIRSNIVLEGVASRSLE